jgi:hypothetical protein
MRFLIPIFLVVFACREPQKNNVAVAVPVAAAPQVENEKPLAAVQNNELSDVLKVPRPQDGEYFGVYLKGQKVGYMFSRVTASTDNKSVTAVNQMHIKAKVGQAEIERHVSDTRKYESKPNGKLLEFTFVQNGDGGEQTLEAKSVPSGMKVTRKRPGKPDEMLNIATSKEVVEDADQTRVALFRNAKIDGVVTDALDLEQYGVHTTLGPTETRTLQGVPVKLRRATTISDKEKVPTEVTIDERGRTLSIDFGSTMMAKSEPKEVAMRVDAIEIFGLTRVELPNAPTDSARKTPGQFSFVASGIPERFLQKSARQQFVPMENGNVKVTVKSFVPKTKKTRPLMDPNGGINLKSSIIVEADAPEIVALAKQIVGDEKDAWVAAKKISSYVNSHLEKAYGVSSDRATDVLKLKSGDCTEHSLLTVALLRAVGIPAKRIDGVVYLMNADKVPALYWHEWVAAYVGEWTELDPTFGQDTADALRFALGEEGGAEITPVIGSMKVVSVE